MINDSYYFYIYICKNMLIFINTNTLLFIMLGIVRERN